MRAAAASRIRCNDMFAAHSWYFRNALVCANYNDLKNGVHADTSYLEQFFGNLLLGESNELEPLERIAV